MKKFINAFNKAVDHNSKNDKKKSFNITYKKLNGRTVKRKIDPMSIRNSVVVAFDHKRKAVRSFKIERLRGMEKAANQYYKEKLTDEEKKLIKQYAKDNKIDMYKVVEHLNEEERFGKKTRNLGYLGALGLGVGSLFPKSKTVKYLMRGGAALSGLTGYAGELGATRADVKRDKLEQVFNMPSFKDRYDKDNLPGGYLYTGKNDPRNAWMDKDPFVQQLRAGIIDGIPKTAFWKGFEKQANLGEHFAHAAEIGGLGILAAPSIQALRGKKMNEHKTHKYELAGLGVLAAPSIAHYAEPLLSKVKNVLK